MPLAAGVGRVDDAPPVARPVGTGLPGRLLVAHEAQRRTRLGLHAPEAAAARDAAAVRDDHELAAVGRPRRREVLVEARVVVAGQAGVALLRETTRLARLAVGRVEHEHVEAPLERRGHERQPTAVGRPARLDVDRAVRQQRPAPSARELERAQLDGVVVIRGVGEQAAVGRPVGLVVVARPVRELARDARVELDAPERAFDRDGQLLSVGGPGGRGDAARGLGQVHLPVVVVVRDADLLQDLLPPGAGLGRSEAGGRRQSQQRRHAGARGAGSACHVARDCIHATLSTLAARDLKPPGAKGGR